MPTPMGMVERKIFRKHQRERTETKECPEGDAFEVLGTRRRLDSLTREQTLSQGGDHIAQRENPECHPEEANTRK
ncbi:hypothetical protein [Zhongshania sp.]|uniref:hypothetical protein n=1 Tax=Zhongshania sp. TaxID=1971902 RepID=UPI001B688E75|nr:hypothetical protein [Zhongshania sp.]MBQ0796201.1 hypothetical protein [Zhongshania sp.]